MGEPATERSQEHATYQDVLDLPEHVVGEIIDGALYVSGRPAKPHTLSASRLGAVLIAAYDLGRGDGETGGPAEPGGWWILDEPELHFRREVAGERRLDVLVPDLAGWRRERLPNVIDGEAAFSLAPDWVCEVSSPSTATLDRVRKMSVYAREGVRHVWLVDPDHRMFEVYRLEGERWLRVTAVSGAETIRAEPFDALPLDLTLLWPPEAPPTDPGS